MARKPADSSKSGSVAALAENLKRSVTEICVLHLLSSHPYYIGELTEELCRRSNGLLDLVCPYGLIYRLIDFEYIVEMRKQRAPDGRRRQYYRITERGRRYLKELVAYYFDFSSSMEGILKDTEENLE